MVLAGSRTSAKAVMALLVLLSATLVGGAANGPAQERPVPRDEFAGIAEALKSRSIPVAGVSRGDGGIIVRIDYPTAPDGGPDRIKADILEVVRAVGPLMGPAPTLKVEAFGLGEPVFEIAVDAASASAFADGRMTEPDLAAHVVRTDRMTMARIFEDARPTSGERLAENGEAERGVSEPAPADGVSSSTDEPLMARLLMLGAAVLLIGFATLGILHLTKRARSQAGPAQARHGLVLPVVLALASLGLLAFAVMVWKEDGLFDPDLETLSAWLFAAAAASAAVVSAALFRSRRSRAARIAAAVFFLIVVPVMAWAFIYLGDQVLVSTADLFFRGDTFERGVYTPKNEREAAKWFLKAAGRGDVRAMERLAAMYDEGRGVPADPARAEEWRRRARGRT